ncbi:hypothetical protein AB0J63_24850 [Streptosporangium canum]|uniref:hypothetical protein n=1 Tax=Streptosporangium canum TaxID=324952 RepID=UPI0034390CAE
MARTVSAVCRRPITTAATGPPATAAPRAARPRTEPAALAVRPVIVEGRGATTCVRRSPGKNGNAPQAVLDPRLATARYSGFLLNSLPPYWRTADPAVVKAALKRLTG